MRLLAAMLSLLVVFFGWNPHVLSAPRDAVGHWAEEALVCGQILGLLRGYPDGTVRPDAVVARAELATMVCRAIGEEGNSRAAARLLPVFPDVPSDHWAVGYMRVCSEAGLLLGDTEGRGLPSKPVSRAEAAAILARTGRLLNLQGKGTRETRFLDESDVPDWAVEDTDYVVKMSLMRGDDRGKFRPVDGMSRSEAVTVLVRLLDLQGSRWDVVGTVVSVDLERASLGLKVSGEEIRLQLSAETRVYRGGFSISASSLKAGSAVRVLLSRETATVAALISTD